MTKLEGCILFLDLANDQKARDAAFTYALSITSENPIFTNQLLHKIEDIEKGNKK